MKRLTLLIVLAAAAGGIVAGRDWILLAANALTYPTTAPGAVANVAVADTIAFATLGESGLAIVSASSGRTLATMPPPPGTGSIDDLAIEGNLLFALDARPPGSLAVFDVSAHLAPRLLGRPIDVPVGPFSGVSAGRGIVVVSGGTSRMTALAYAAGGMGPVVATQDLGRGQPDVFVSPSRPVAWVSTHYAGPSFGVDAVRLPDLARVSALPLEGAGFTSGGAHPATFPLAATELSPDTLLVAQRTGLLVIDVTRPDAPAIVALVDLGAPAVHVAAHAGVAAVSLSGRPAVALVEFGAAPVVRRRIELPPGTVPGGVALTANTVVVAAGARGVLVFDRSTKQGRM